jgi:hypothetical protein
MELSKLRGGELIAAIGGIVLLLALLFLDWYGIEGAPGQIGDIGAWDDQGFLGTLANLVILAAGVVAVGLALVTATASNVALPVAASALTAAFGVAATVMVLLRMLFQPDVEVLGLKIADTNLEFGIFVALAGALAVAYGGWQSIQEEGATSRRSGMAQPQ